MQLYPAATAGRQPAAPVPVALGRATAGCGALYPLLERWWHSLLDLDLAGGAHQPTVDEALRQLAAPDTEHWPPPPLRRLDLCGAAGLLPAVQLEVAACARARPDLVSRPEAALQR